MEVLQLSDPASRSQLMSADVTLLYRNERFTSCAMLILCFLDALASPGRDSSRGDFEAYLGAHFKALINELAPFSSPKTPGHLLYDSFRNGLLHRLTIKGSFALARDNEVSGSHVAEVAVPGHGKRIAINIDKLVSGFLSHLESLDDGAAA